MPRRLLKKICPSPGTLQKRWYLRPFGDRIADPRLWTLHRRAVTSAFGVGLAICFIPLPVHLLVAGIIAIALRINLPAIYGTTLLVNPLTCVPVYYTAYRVGTTMLGISPETFRFQARLGVVSDGAGARVEAVPAGVRGVCRRDGAGGVADAGARLEMAGNDEIPGEARTRSLNRLAGA